MKLVKLKQQQWEEQQAATKAPPVLSDKVRAQTRTGCRRGLSAHHNTTVRHCADRIFDTCMPCSPASCWSALAFHPNLEISC